MPKGTDPIRLVYSQAAQVVHVANVAEACALDTGKLDGRRYKLDRAANNPESI